MTQVKQHVLAILTSGNSPDAMLLDVIIEATGYDTEEIKKALIDLQDEELVFLRNGWYSASAVGRNQATSPRTI